MIVFLMDCSDLDVFLTTAHFFNYCLTTAHFIIGSKICGR